MGEQQLNEFPPASLEAWRKLVERDLKGAGFEERLVKTVAGDIRVQPLYDASAAQVDGAGLPGAAPFVRGGRSLGHAQGGWEIRQEQRHPDPRRAAEDIREDLAGGVSGVSLRFDRATRAGRGPTAGLGEDGVACPDLAALDALLGHVDLAVTPVTLNAGASALPLAAGLFVLAERRGVPRTALRGSLGADPLAALARWGALPCSVERALDELADLGGYTARHAPGLRAVCVDGSVYHDAGAHAAQELGMVLATGVRYLRTMTERGLDVSEAARQVTLRLAVGRDFFLEIAKLRAARALWASVVRACGGDEASQAAPIHAQTSARTKTQRDPWVNLLRGTTESFAAVVGGADSVGTSPFDEAIGPSDDFSRRMARNTQLLLLEESNLHRVIDPAGGSWYVEQLTEQLAARAWAVLQDLERRGGAAQALLDGSFADEVARTAEAEEREVAHRKLAITGVNEFPNVREEPVTRPTASLEALRERARAAAEDAPTIELQSTGEHGTLTAQAVAAVTGGAPFAALRDALNDGAGVTARAFELRRYARGFEALRDASDAYRARTGARPQAFLANLGPIPTHKARAMFAQNFMEAGGFEAQTNDGFASAEDAARAFAESGAQVAVICSSDELYETLAADTAVALHEAGAQAIVLAGKPDAEREARYREAGVTDFIFVGCDVQAALQDLLARLEVL